jgi:predicted amidohydrolase YtcJ
VTVIVNADLGAAAPTRIRIDGPRIADIGPWIEVTPGETVLDAAGGAVIPGLHDHHIHLYALAAARESVAVGPPDVRAPSEFVAAIRAAARSLAPGRWLRGVGYHESVLGRLDRWVLDAATGNRPVRVQHRTGIEWVVNSSAVRELGLDGLDHPGVERTADGVPTGRLTRMDDWLGRVLPSTPPDVESIGREASRLGVVAFTDATPLRTAEQTGALVRAGLRQRVTYMTAPDAGDTGAWPEGRGPVKVILDDNRLPALENLAETVARAHAAGRSVAVHCVTRTQTVLTVAALRSAGSRRGDRIEHGSVIPGELTAALLDLGVTVVTNPGFVHARGDSYVREVDPADLGLLYRCGSLLRAGVAVAGGTDAPYGPADPWLSIATAVGRVTSGGAVLGAGERIDAMEALGLFTAGREVAIGHRADLCLLAVPRRALAATELTSKLVAVTLIGGAVEANKRQL